jgi:hypothetical protein
MPVLATAYTPLHAADGSDLGPVCPMCGSQKVVPIEWHGPTGVVAPDGGEEFQTQFGYRCLDCGAVEEE